MNALNLLLSMVYVLEATSELSTGAIFWILTGFSVVFILSFTVFLLREWKVERSDMTGFVWAFIVLVCCLVIGTQYVTCREYGWDYCGKDYRLISLDEKIRYEGRKNYRVLDLSSLSQEEYAMIVSNIKR